MARFAHEPGNRYLILDGVRRAKAAQLHDHGGILAEIFDRSGASLGTCQIPLDALVSPKKSIRRVTAPEQVRWQRAEEGAKEPKLPFPAIFLQPTKRKKPVLSDVDFEDGEES